jgi:hypothetical protein
MRGPSQKDLDRWLAAVVKLEGAANTTEADWVALRAGEKKLGPRKLEQLREQARLIIAETAPKPGAFDLRAEFQKAVDRLTEIGERMDFVYHLSVDGIPVPDPDDAKWLGQKLTDAKTGVAAMNVKRLAAADLTKLLNLMIPEANEVQTDSDLERAVAEYLLPLKLTAAEVPLAEVVRLAGSEIMRLQTVNERKLRVVG